MTLYSKILCQWKVARDPLCVVQQQERDFFPLHFDFKHKVFFANVYTHINIYLFINIHIYTEKLQFIKAGYKNGRAFPGINISS